MKTRIESNGEITETQRVCRCSNTPHKALLSPWVEINTNIKELLLANFIWRTQPSICGGINSKVQMMQDTWKDGPKHSVSFQIYFLTHEWPFSSNESREAQLISRYVQETFDLVLENTYFYLFPFHDFPGIL